jgi:hypothetical protein
MSLTFLNLLVPYTPTKLREAAHRAFIILSDYIAQLNADPTLYQALASVTDNATYFHN